MKLDEIIIIIIALLIGFFLHGVLSKNNIVDSNVKPFKNKHSKSLVGVKNWSNNCAQPCSGLKFTNGKDVCGMKKACGGQQYTNDTGGCSNYEMSGSCCDLNKCGPTPPSPVPTPPPPPPPKPPSPPPPNENPCSIGEMGNCTEYCKEDSSTSEHCCSGLHANSDTCSLHCEHSKKATIDCCLKNNNKNNKKTNYNTCKSYCALNNKHTSDECCAIRDKQKTHEMCEIHCESSKATKQECCIKGNMESCDSYCGHNGAGSECCGVPPFGEDTFDCFKKDQSK
tara:strand:+ start:808 stop:1653 length:846 start_codon:yes stop_codon:yes gene_type:complete